VFLFYERYTVSNDVFSFVKGQSSIFKGEMAVTICFLCFIIIVERYANRTDTKHVEEKRQRLSKLPKQGEEENFFKADEIFKKTSTQRSMTVSVKTVKTSEIDIHGNSEHEYLASMYDQDDEKVGADDDRTKITKQQKTKFIIHWILLIGAHIYVFWYIPIKGNITLYGQPNCNYEKAKFYTCKNFHENTFLRIFYVLTLIYMTLSAL
jgi:hypothetical protein